MTQKYRDQYTVISYMHDHDMNSVSEWEYSDWLTNIHKFIIERANAR